MFGYERMASYTSCSMRDDSNTEEWHRLRSGKAALARLPTGGKLRQIFIDAPAAVRITRIIPCPIEKLPRSLWWSVLSAASDNCNSVSNGDWLYIPSFGPAAARVVSFRVQVGHLGIFPGGPGRKDCHSLVHTKSSSFLLLFYMASNLTTSSS